MAQGDSTCGRAWLHSFPLLKERPGSLEVPCEIARPSGLPHYCSLLMPKVIESLESVGPQLPRHLFVCAMNLPKAVTSNQAIVTPWPVPLLLPACVCVQEAPPSMTLLLTASKGHILSTQLKGHFSNESRSYFKLHCQGIRSQ